MRRGDLYQIVLITLGVIATFLFGAFLYREVYPEYAIYQNIYKDLEKFRSTYTGEPAPAFKDGIKQIVILDKNHGPEVVDRCVSCHVALEFEHFSPTKIAYDINGKMQLDENGFPMKISNEEYVWAKLDQKIEELLNKETNDRLIAEGKQRDVNNRLALAEQYKSLKQIKVGEKIYDVSKVLLMHPLIGRETRPFEFHPIDDTSCTACHNGNGRGLTTENAHGPVLDGQYEAEFMGHVPKFLEIDPENDPKFSKVFNHKPGHSLLFQTTPLFIGGLIEAKCIQCHKSSKNSLQDAYMIANQLAEKKKQKLDNVTQAYETELAALITLLKLKESISNIGIEATYRKLENQEKNYTLTSSELEIIKSQENFLRKYLKDEKFALVNLESKIKIMIGSSGMKSLQKDKINKKIVSNFIEDHRQDPNFHGSLFDKANAVNLEKSLIEHVLQTEENFQVMTQDQKNISSMISDVDLLTKNYKRGEELFLSQACYACHRIAGLSRGGIGPELTEEGKKYPWFIKESIVWPQADLRTSTMPNFKLDHEELEALTTFLLGQQGKTLEQSDIEYKVAIQQWDLGKRPRSWEKELIPSRIHDLDYAMEVFAIEGCAACHRLKGFESNVGFTIEKKKNDFDSIQDEKNWFKSLFPEDINGSNIVEIIEKNKDEIDKRISNDVRKDSILEKIERKFPKSLEALYSNFKFALRAKNNKANEKKEWKERVHKILMVYIQEYGLGRLVGPRPNWSGIYRSDEWLMEHFKNPSSHVARSIMPVFPFTNDKFYALTNMLDQLAQKNRDEVRELWSHQGFNPKIAYDMHCSQCHGEYLQGNGPVSQWIYPIPKSLRNADFLRNLTREKAYDSIHHGVKGTPMPPWGELGDDKNFKNTQPILTKEEIGQIVDWIFSNLPGRSVIKSTEDVPKWKYKPQDVIEEMKKEGQILKSKNNLSFLPFKDDTVISSFIPSSFNKKKESKNEIEEFFDIKKDKNNEETYYIKKKFYTKENLEEAKTIFLRDCSVCHGREADGAGNRAGAMISAKPRMLTNLDWLESRDDLRLLRSIKYGVPGTAMTAWGDQTSAKQRMALVMYIRSISEEAMFRNALFKETYQAYNEPELLVENLRSQNFSKINEINEKLKKVQEERLSEDLQARKDDKAENKAIETYKTELELSRLKKQLNKGDKILSQLISEIRNERALMVDLGLSLISQRNNGIDPQQFNKILELEKMRFSFENNHLSLKYKSEKINEIEKKLVDEIDHKIQLIHSERTIQQGKIASSEINALIDEMDRKEKSLDELKRKVISTIVKTKKIKEKEKELINKYYKFSENQENL